MEGGGASGADMRAGGGSANRTWRVVGDTLVMSTKLHDAKSGSGGRMQRTNTRRTVPAPSADALQSPTHTCTRGVTSVIQ